MELGNAKQNTLVNKRESNKYYVSNEIISEDNKNDSHSLIAIQVKQNSVVLDVGCAQGLIGNYLNKKRNCKVYGIEIDEQARKIAFQKKVYEKIYDFSIMDKKSKKYISFFNEQIKFDYIIFADVLEHLIDPADTIYEFQKLLSPTGKIIISVPNISHFDIIHGLLNDKFNYSKAGLLDNTHLRFFTKTSFIEMINELNEYYGITLKVKLLNTTQIEPEYMDNYPYIKSILNENKNVNILQNIFELSIGKIKKNKIEEDTNLCQKLEEKYIHLINENNKLRNEITGIYNSRSYKLIQKFCKIKKIFKRGK